MKPEPTLLVFQTHPIQYLAPVFRAVQTDLGIPVTVVYGSDFSVAGCEDEEFGTAFMWDTDLLSGYTSVFLARGARATNIVKRISCRGMDDAVRGLRVGAALLTGYNLRFHRGAFRLCRRSGYPLLFRGETTDHAVRRSALRRFVRDRALQRFYRHFARLLYIGRHSRAHFTRLKCDERRLVFSPYCVDTESFQPGEDARFRLRASMRHNLGIRDSQRVVLFSGKLSRRKGPDLLLQAVEQLPLELRRETVVLFLGAGELRGALENEANSRLCDVRFVGFQNQTHLSPYYHAADVLALPSLHSETWGLVVNEALHHGLPCVVSQAVGSAPDLVVPALTGEIFETGSADGLNAALRRAFELTSRPAIRLACRALVGGYTVYKAAGAIASAYWDIVSGHAEQATAGR